MSKSERPQHLQPTQRSEEVRLEAKRLLLHIHFCTYCGKKGNLYVGPDGEFWEMEHIVPLHKCGEDHIRNITKSCKTCNARKGTSLWSACLDGKRIITAASIREKTGGIIWSLELIRKENPRFAQLMDWRLRIVQERREERKASPSPRTGRKRSNVRRKKTPKMAEARRQTQPSRADNILRRKEVSDLKARVAELRATKKISPHDHWRGYHYYTKTNFHDLDKLRRLVADLEALP